MMNVLWITNTCFPEAQSLLIGNEEFKTSGGWLIGASEQLSKTGEISLSVMTMSKLVNRLTYLKGKYIQYIIVPYCSDSFSNKVRKQLQEIKDKIEPDIVHIHGTEYPLGLSYIQTCGSDNVIVSIQGLIGEISKYYLYGIRTRDIILNYTLRDLLCGSLYSEKKDFQKRSELEKVTLMRVKHVIGRTSFDHDHVLSINNNVNYHFCNETLRNEFYTGMWSYQNCDKHRIFLSQASYPIKGLHYFLQSLPYVRQKYPDVKVFIAGFDLTCRNGSIWRKLLVPGYGLYIRKLIDNLKLNDVVYFTGSLNAYEMKEQLLKSNVFVCPSIVENSPNSLGEAQMLGVPCIASYVGGVPDMIPNAACGLMYRCEDSEMLAQRIMEVFDSSSTLNMEEMRSVAHLRHSPDRNLIRLVDIYSSILRNLNNLKEE